MLKSVIKYILGILIGLSFGFFSIVNLITYTSLDIILTGAISFLVGSVICIKYFDSLTSYITKKLGPALLVVILSFITMYQGYLTKGLANIYNDYELINCFRFRYYMAAIPACFILGIIVFRFLETVIMDIFKDIDKNQKRDYIVISVIMSVLVILAYMSVTLWYMQYDDLYSIDSSFVIRLMFPKLEYFDIRHPILSILTFPIYALAKTLTDVFAPAAFSVQITAIFIQIINIQMLLLVALMIQKLTNKRILFYLYICTFPVLLFGLSLEKYQLCTLILVMYIYTKLKNIKGSNELFILTAGTMPTNGFIGIIEFTNIKNLIKLAVSGVLSLVCLGRISLVNPLNLVTKISEMHNSFGTGTFSITERFISVINMIESSFVSLSSTTESGKYLWENLSSHISIGAYIIAALVLIGAIAGIKEKYYRICSLWVIFSFILFVALNWAPKESPLFALVFSFGIISLFSRGLDFILDILKVSHKEYVYIAIMVILLVINISTLIDINIFFVLKGAL